MDRLARIELVYTGSDSRPGSRSEVPHLPPPLSAAAPAAAQLRHPGPQHEARPQQQGGLDPQTQRVVALLCRELDDARAKGAEAAAELQRLKAEAPQRRSSDAHKHTSRTTVTAAQPGPMAPSSGSGSRIAAFRPPGAAQPPAGKARPSRAVAAAEAEAAQAAGGGQVQAQLQALQQDNAELKSQLQVLFGHCRHLQRQLDSAAAAPPPPPPPAAAARPSSPCRRPRSPGRATLLVASPRAGGAAADLAVAVFQPAPDGAEELRLALNRAQRDCLKLSSKLARARDELADRGAEARRWQAAAEQQGGQLAEARVEAEAERRRCQELEQALAAVRGEREAARADAAALLAQLRAAEATAAAVEGEAACARGQLAVAEEQLARAQREADRLKEEAAATAARLAATDLVRREAERERDELELQAQRLRAALADAQASGGAAEEELAAALARAQQELAAERQRCEMLQAQAALAEAQGRETERLLTEQLRATQEERNSCLAAATRADALLAKLGRHAMLMRGADG